MGNSRNIGIQNKNDVIYIFNYNFYKINKKVNVLKQLFPLNVKEFSKDFN